MDCREVQHLLHAYFDGELDLVRHVQVDDHLADCTECAEGERALRLLRDSIASAPLYHHAPSALRDRLLASPKPVRRQRSLAFFAAAAVVLLATAALTAGVFWPRLAALAEDRLTAQVVASHIRSLQVDHLTDVASTDQHTVKPWFQGKLDFSPHIVDLSSSGYALFGGRMDYLTDRPVAALLYHRRQHVINLFTWPAADDEDRPVRTQDRQGFHICSWQRSGMAYWAISDLNPRDLDDFVQLLREHATTPLP